MDENKQSKTFNYIYTKLNKHSKEEINYSDNSLLLNNKPYHKYTASPRKIRVCF